MSQRSKKFQIGFAAGYVTTFRRTTILQRYQELMGEATR